MAADDAGGSGLSMSISFDWEITEEEAEESLPPEGGGKRHRWSRWLRWGVAVFLFLAIASIIAGVWIKGRLDTVKRVEQELKTAVELELKTIADRDVELYRGRQDPDDARWQSRQSARYIYSAERFVPAPGLAHSDRPVQIDRVHVLGRTGRVELTRWFEPASRAPLQELRFPNPDPLPFHFTWFYRQNEDGVWYHTAPPRGYWGVPYAWRGSRLVIRATEAEAGLLDPIARELAGLILDGCQRLGCPERIRYTLSFEGDIVPRIQGNWWALPALNLTGLPANDAARTAWKRVLKLWLVDVLVQTQTGDVDLARRVIYHHLVSRLQTDVGVSGDATTEPTAAAVELVAAALREGRQHTLQDLWAAEYGAIAPKEVPLLETEVALLLQWLEEPVGRERLPKLLLALKGYGQLDAALTAVYNLAPPDLAASWNGYLYERTGVSPAPVSVAQVPPTPSPTPQPLKPPPEPPPLSVPAGDQIAFICDGRVWVGNANGSNVVPLTARGERFAEVHWSPDGRQLLTTWTLNLTPSRSSEGSERRALYLLAADGSSRRLLTDDPALPTQAVRWSPDGSEIIYLAWRDGTERPPETWALDIETGDTRRLEATPLWSPDGEYLVYVTEPPDSLASTVWLAGGNWERPLVVARDVGVWLGAAWSPDSAMVAGGLYDVDLDQDAIWILDADTARLTPLATASDLLTATRSFEGGLLDGGDPSTLEGEPLQNLWTAGWSADGRQLAVWAQWQREGRRTDNGRAPIALTLLPLDGSALRVLAYDDQAVIYSAAWSPTDPDQLAFGWSNGARSSQAVLFDLQAGPVYTATQDWVIADWSPDGQWVAFAGHDRVTVVDREGRDRYAFGNSRSCSAVAWNPAADLTGMGASPAVASLTPGWSFANVRVYADPESPALRVWGELVNQTGGEKRVRGLIPRLRDGAGNRVLDEQRVRFPPGYGDMLQAVSLADGHSVPVGFTLPLPEGFPVEDDYAIVVNVEDFPDRPTRADLDITFDVYDLAAWPDRLLVRGIFENPGPALDEFVTAVITAFDLGGQVIGWGWTHWTEGSVLRGGGHYFEVSVPAPEIASDLKLRVGSYKIHLIGR